MSNSTENTVNVPVASLDAFNATIRQLNQTGTGLQQQISRLNEQVASNNANPVRRFDRTVSGTVEYM